MPMSRGSRLDTPMKKRPPPNRDVWRGLEVVAGNRCSTYEAEDYSYPQSREDDIIAPLFFRERAVEAFDEPFDHGRSS